MVDRVAAPVLVVAQSPGDNLQTNSLQSRELRPVPKQPGPGSPRSARRRHDFVRDRFFRNSRRLPPASVEAWRRTTSKNSKRQFAVATRGHGAASTYKTGDRTRSDP